VATDPEIQRSGHLTLQRKSKCSVWEDSQRLEGHIPSYLSFCEGNVVPDLAIRRFIILGGYRMLE
jgi:hypothetical protein